MDIEALASVLEQKVGEQFRKVRPDELSGLMERGNGQSVFWWHIAKPGNEPGVQNAPQNFDAVIGVAAASLAGNPEPFLYQKMEIFLAVLDTEGYEVAIRGPFAPNLNGDADRFPVGVEVRCVWLYPKAACGWGV